MSQGFYTWSRTASANAGADGSIGWAEGQAPSSINDSARAMMARTAEYRDDVTGATVTAGSSTAYTVGSNQVFDSLAHLANQIVAFTPHATNGAGPVTLSVDGLGAKPLRTSPGVDLLAGTIIVGTPYVALYNLSDSAFYLQSFYGSSPYLIPLAAGMDFWGSTAPNSSFAFPAGQAISRTTYATLFAIMGTTYGTGDGTTTFNLPNKTGRVSAMQEASASLLTSTYFGGNSTVLGATGGGESHALSLGELPTGITSNGAVISPAGVYLTAPVTGYGIGSFSTNGGSTVFEAFSASASLIQVNTITSTGTLTSNNTSGSAHRTVQPTIVCNYILRII